MTTYNYGNGSSDLSTEQIEISYLEDYQRVPHSTLTIWKAVYAKPSSTARHGYGITENEAILEAVRQV